MSDIPPCRVADAECPISSRGILRDEWVPFCRRPECSPKGETIDLIAFTVACFYFLRFQPKNRVSSPQTT